MVYFQNDPNGYEWWRWQWQWHIQTDQPTDQRNSIYSKRITITLSSTATAASLAATLTTPTNITAAATTTQSNNNSKKKKKKKHHRRRWRSPQRGIHTIQLIIVEGCEIIEQRRSNQDEDPERGTIDLVRFRQWVEDKLVPVLGNYRDGEPRSIVYCSLWQCRNSQWLCGSYWTSYGSTLC